MVPAGLVDSYRLLTGLAGPVPAEPLAQRYTLKTPHDDFAVDVYETPSPGAPTIIFNHGLSPSASADPRFVKLARGFARQGYRVVAPLYPTLRRLEITGYTIEEMVAVYNALARGDTVPMTLPAAVFSVSLSAALGMIAATDPRVELPLSSLMSLGGHADLGVTMRHLLSVPAPLETRDDYGRLVFLQNWLDDIAPHASLSVRAVLRQAIADNLIHDDTASNALAARLEGSDAELWRAMSKPGDPELTRKCHAVIDAKADLCRRLSPIHHVGRCRIPIHLIHGRADPVIPASQTRALDAALRRRGAPVKTLFTDALGHAEPVGISPRLIWDQLALVAFFGRWLHSVRAATGTVDRRPARASAPARTHRPHWRNSHGKNPVGL